MKYLCKLATLLILAFEGHLTIELCLNPPDYSDAPGFLSPHEIRGFMNTTLHATLAEIAVAVVIEEELGIPPQHQFVNCK